MYAMVNKGGGKYYTSTVFAFYDDDEKAETASCWGRYYIVLNEEKTALVKQYVFDVSVKPMLHKMILVTDNSHEDWVVDDKKGFGAIGSTNKDDLLKMIEQGRVSDELLALDRAYEYEAYPEIHDEKDIENLMTVSGWFHDAYIENLEERDGMLYVLFDGIWGGKIEMWFRGDVEYDVSSRDPEKYDPYWFGSTMVIEDGFIYFVDEEDMEIRNIGEGYCWFKARKVRYHVIPD